MTHGPGLIKLKEEFKHWLQLLGFAASTAKSLPNYINEMLHYLEANNITTAQEITEEAIKNFFFQWKNRKNKNTGAGLSQKHINKGITAINNFIKFLKKTGKKELTLKLEHGKEEAKAPQILSPSEIKSLYEATYTYSGRKRNNPEAFGQRDRAMLAIYYGCGLRKNEGVNLEVSDILWDKHMIYVRKGKGNKERYVPITAATMQDIQEYLDYGRKWFLKQRQKKQEVHTEAFFVNIWGDPMTDFAVRLNNLKEEAGINKTVRLHLLRHSIATHLLQEGMQLEQIQKFLGHSSLESTQIYTHIVNELYL